MQILSRADESTMNLEAMGVTLAAFSWKLKQGASGRSYGLCPRGAIIRPTRIISILCTRPPPLSPYIRNLPYRGGAVRYFRESGFHEVHFEALRRTAVVPALAAALDPLFVLLAVGH